MTKSQKEYWKRQHEAGRKKITIVISQEAQNILVQKKAVSKKNYSMIIEQALLGHFEKQSNIHVTDKKISELEHQLEIVSVNFEENNTKLQKIETQLNNKIAGNERRIKDLERRMPRRKKKIIR